MIKSLISLIFPNKIFGIVLVGLLSISGFLYWQSSSKDTTISDLNRDLGTLSSELAIEKGKVLERDAEITRINSYNKIFEDQRLDLAAELAKLEDLYGDSLEANKKLKELIKNSKGKTVISKQCTEGSSVNIEFEEVTRVKLPKDVIDFINGSNIRL